jgi:hypothetical protein
MDIARSVLSLPRRSSAATWRVAQAAAGLVRAAEQVPIMLIRVDALLTAVEVLVRQASETSSAAAGLVARVDGVQAAAVRVVGEIDAVQQRAGRLVASIEPLVAVMSEIDVSLVRSTVRIVDDLQPLLQAMTLLKPDLVDELLGELKDNIPDLREILAVVTRLEPVLTDVETRIAGLPGAALLRKRGEREIAAAEADTKD